MKKIKMARCAYIFERNNVKYGTHEEIKKMVEYENHLKINYYDNYYNNNELLSYKTETVKSWSGETFEKIIVNFGGEIGEHVIKDLRSIEKIIVTNGEELTEQEKKINSIALLPTLASCGAVANTHFIINENNLYLDDFKSSWLENFQDEKESLNYLRIHFKNNRVNFRILTTGEIVTAEGLQMNILTNNDIINSLGATSQKAKKKINEILNALRSAVAVPWWEY